MSGAASSNAADSRKRKCRGPPDSIAPRDQVPASALAAYPKRHGGIVDEEDESSSVEALLAVPIGFIFCETRPPEAGAVSGPSAAARSSAATQPHTPSHRRRTTLLARSEASAFLRVNQLSAELDVLRSVASEALDRTRLARDLRDRIERGGRSAGGRIGSAYLRPLLPLLEVHGTGVPRRAVAHVAAESGRILSELGGCASALRQFAEQNWTVSDQLCDAFGYDEGGPTSTGSGLGKEKRAVAEVEEAVSARIEGLVGMAVIERGGRDDMAGDGCVDAFDVGTDKDTGVFIPMRELCRQLLVGSGCEFARAADKAKTCAMEKMSGAVLHKENGADKDGAFGASSKDQPNSTSRGLIGEKTKSGEVAIDDSNTKLPSAALGESNEPKQYRSDAELSTIKTHEDRKSDGGNNEVEVPVVNGSVTSGIQDAAAALAVLASS